MNDTTVALLTPPGTGAIATLAVGGPRAWDVVRELFRPATKNVPAAPIVGRFWFGTLGEIGEEVVLACLEPEQFEIHCHGGERIVQLLIHELRQHEIKLIQLPRHPLTLAPTLRTAAIILEQTIDRRFQQVIRSILDRWPQSASEIAALAQFSNLGRHLTTPWQIAIVGPPNVGKSSLMNALAGFDRSIVSPVAGTTRDVVAHETAIDGWPVTFSDTAGLRVTDHPIESIGVSLAKQAASEADLIIEVHDATEQLAQPFHPTALQVVNKWDLASTADHENRPFPFIPTSARTGLGIAELTAAISTRLVPRPPSPGQPVPYHLGLCDYVKVASEEVTAGRLGHAKAALESARAEDDALYRLFSSRRK